MDLQRDANAEPNGDQDEPGHTDYDRTLKNEYSNIQENMPMPSEHKISSNNRSNEFLIEDQAEEPDIITDHGNFMEPLGDMSSILVQNQERRASGSKEAYNIGEQDVDAFNSSNADVQEPMIMDTTDKLNDADDLSMSVSANGARGSGGLSSASNKYKRNRDMTPPSQQRYR